MAVLTTYHGVVEKEGIVRVREGALLPAGTEVIIVAAELASLEEQKRRLANIPASEWGSLSTPCGLPGIRLNRRQVKTIFRATRNWWRWFVQAE